MKDEYVYGRGPVMELLKNGSVTKLYIQKGSDKGSVRVIYAMAMEKNIVISYLDKNRMDEMVSGNHQGVIALKGVYKYAEIEDILKYAEEKGEDPKIVILDEIEDPHNFGAIARTVEVAGFHGIIIPRRRSALVTDTVYKASAGAVEHLNIARVGNISQAIEQLKDRGFWIYGAHMEGQSAFKTDLTGKIALVIGNEGRGLGEKVKKSCDSLISIPMKGHIGSLNASCAAAVLIYEVLRQENEI